MAEGDDKRRDVPPNPNQGPPDLTGAVYDAFGGRQGRVGRPDLTYTPGGQTYHDMVMQQQRGDGRFSQQQGDVIRQQQQGQQPPYRDAPTADGGNVRTHQNGLIEKFDKNKQITERTLPNKAVEHFENGKIKDRVYPNGYAIKFDDKQRPTEITTPQEKTKLTYADDKNKVGSFEISRKDGAGKEVVTERGKPGADGNWTVEKLQADGTYKPDASVKGVKNVELAPGMRLEYVDQNNYRVDRQSGVGLQRTEADVQMPVRGQDGKYYLQAMRPITSERKPDGSVTDYQYSKQVRQDGKEYHTLNGYTTKDKNGNITEYTVKKPQVPGQPAVADEWVTLKAKPGQKLDPKDVERIKDLTKPGNDPREVVGRLQTLQAEMQNGKLPFVLDKNERVVGVALDQGTGERRNIMANGDRVWQSTDGRTFRQNSDARHEKDRITVTEKGPDGADRLMRSETRDGNKFIFHYDAQGKVSRVDQKGPDKQERTPDGKVKVVPGAETSVTRVGNTDTWKDSAGKEFKMQVDAGKDGSVTMTSLGADGKPAGKSRALHTDGSEILGTKGADGKLKPEMILGSEGVFTRVTYNDRGEPTRLQISYPNEKIEDWQYGQVSQDGKMGWKTPVIENVTDNQGRQQYDQRTGQPIRRAAVDPRTGRPAERVFEGRAQVGDDGNITWTNPQGQTAVVRRNDRPLSEQEVQAMRARQQQQQQQQRR